MVLGLGYKKKAQNLLNKEVTQMDERSAVEVGCRGLGFNFLGGVTAGPQLKKGAALNDQSTGLGMGRTDERGVGGSGPIDSGFESGHTRVGLGPSRASATGLLHTNTGWEKITRLPHII